MMLILATARRTKQMNLFAANGEWRQGRPLLNHIPRLMGQTLGLVSFGNVARCTAKRAKAFGMHVITYDPYVSELTISEHGVEPVSFGELLERSDYISVHSPHNEETEHLLNAAAFARMKDGVAIVNTARGPIIDEPDLVAAIESGKVGAAGLDVLEQEPPAPDNPLLTMDNVIVTPHVASATTRMRPTARRRVGQEVALVLRGKWPMSCGEPHGAAQDAPRALAAGADDRGPEPVDRDARRPGRPPRGSPMPRRRSSRCSRAIPIHTERTFRPSV